MYWTDDNANRIYRANLDGTNSTIIISTDLSCPGKLLRYWDTFSKAQINFSQNTSMIWLNGSEGITANY